jgi:hypothetical protein
MNDAFKKLKELDKRLKEIREEEGKIKNEIVCEVKRSFNPIKEKIKEIARRYKINNKSYPLFVFLDISYTSYLKFYYLSRKGVSVMDELGNSNRVRLRDFRSMYFDVLDGDYYIYLNNKPISPIEFYVNLFRVISDANTNGFDLKETISILDYALYKNRQLISYIPEWLRKEYEKNVGKMLMNITSVTIDDIVKNIPVILYSHN